MELYIEKDFLENFKKYYSNDSIQNIVKNIFQNYGSKTIFMNVTIDSFDDFEKLKLKNEFFALICSQDKSPINVKSIKSHLFSNSNFKQTMVFMNKKKDWFNEVENKGVLCFCFDDYQEKIKEIIDNLHFKIDLSEGFKGWDFLNDFENLNYNHITITDGYILVDKDKQKMNDNIIQILKILLNNKKKNIKIDILTKELNPISSKEEHKKEKAKKRYKVLEDVFGNQKNKFSIIMDDSELNRYDFHDRIIQTNFSLTECGKGFNLSRSKISNSKIESETIFDKFTYDRLRRHQIMQEEYIERLKTSPKEIFKIYP